MTRALIIFLKYPELGRCKTRLAESIGDENALKIYKKLLSHSHQITKDLPIQEVLLRVSNLLYNKPIISPSSLYLSSTSCSAYPSFIICFNVSWSNTLLYTCYCCCCISNLGLNCNPERLCCAPLPQSKCLSYYTIASPLSTCLGDTIT